MGTPPELEERGRAIWLSFGGDALPAGFRTLVHEIARLADTLDRLDALAMGRKDEWASLVFNDMGEVHLTVDGLLSERRQQQMAFKQLLMEARTAGLKQAGGGPVAAEDQGRGGLIRGLQNRAG